MFLRACALTGKRREARDRFGNEKREKERGPDRLCRRRASSRRRRRGGTSKRDRRCTPGRRRLASNPRASCAWRVRTGSHAGENRRHPASTQHHDDDDGSAPGQRQTSRCGGNAATHAEVDVPGPVEFRPVKLTVSFFDADAPLGRLDDFGGARRWEQVAPSCCCCCSRTRI